MRILTFLLPILFYFQPLYPQDTLAIHYARLIHMQSLKQHIKTLASEQMEGRHTGDPGQKRAAVYLYRQFKGMQILSPKTSFDSLDYFQTFVLEAPEAAKALISLNSRTYSNMKDFLFEGQISGRIDSLPIVFLRKELIDHIAYSDLSDKAILFLSNNLRVASYKANSIHKQTGAKVFLYANKKMPQQYERLINSRKRILARKKYHLLDTLYKDSNGIDSLKNPTLYKLLKEIPKTMSFAISPELFQQIMGQSLKKVKTGIKQKHRTTPPLTPESRYINLKVQKQSIIANSENVLAYIPGKAAKSETIVISAHYDHIGKKKKEIFYGANDNASGTAALLELAKAFQRAYLEGNGPRKSILFIAFSGEEKGLLGSEFYVRHPAIPLNQTCVNLNIDMIGRKDVNHDDFNYIHLLGTNHLAPALRSISDSINNLYTQMELDYRFDQADNFFYHASDQASFVKHKIPAIFYFNGLHNDYHRSTDTTDKINYKAAAKTCRLIFHTAWELANRTGSLKE